MWNKLAISFAVLAWALPAQTLTGKVDLPKDSPVTMVALDWGQSSATVRGSAYVLDIHASLSLRNSGQKRVRGITLAVVAQEVTPGGKGSISVPSLDVAPGDTFAVKIDLPLMRPLGPGTPGAEVRLDGLLFDDLSFTGPDKLNSRRSMTLWELEARRDRKYFKSILETAGKDALQKEMLASLAREADRPMPGMQMVRGRSTNVDADKEMTFAFLQVPESPVEPHDGTSKMSGNEARAPRFEVKNRSSKPIKYVDFGWVVRDQQGREFQAASMPAEVTLAPGQSAPVVQDAALRFPANASVQAMSGYVAHVEYADGTFWVPSRSALDEAKVRAIAGPSPEEQRLMQIYRKRGLAAVVDELKKF